MMTVYEATYAKQSILRDIDAALMAAHDGGFRKLRLVLSPGGVYDLAFVTHDLIKMNDFVARDLIKPDDTGGATCDPIKVTGKSPRITGYRHPRTGETVPLDREPSLGPGRLEIRGTRGA